MIAQKSKQRNTLIKTVAKNIIIKQRIKKFKKM